MSKCYDWLSSTWSPYTAQQAQKSLERKIINGHIGLCFSLREYTTVCDEMESALDIIAMKPIEEETLQCERKTKKDEVNEAGQDTCNSALNTDQGHDDSITGIRLSPRSQSEPSVSVELEPRTKPVSILSFGNQAKKYLTKKLSGVALTKSKTKSVTFQLPTASDESDLPLQGPSGISQQSSSSEDDIKDEDLAYGKEGFNQYKLYMDMERVTQIEEIFNERERLRSLYKHRISSIKEIIEVARAYYVNPDERAVEEWRKLKQGLGMDQQDQSQTYIRAKLAKLLDFSPVFTVFISLLQLLTCVILVALGGITSMGLESKVVHRDGVQTFLGIETVHKWTVPNTWIGPSHIYMISVGAFFAPCMRDDIEIRLLALDKNYTTTEELGCCELDRRNTAATTTARECLDLTQGTGAWKAGIKCSERPSGENSVAHILKPCCYNLQSECMLTTHEHCTFLGGFYSNEGPEHCTQVNCLSSICGMGGLSSSPDQPWVAYKPRQWWRLLLSLIYHHGLIHVVVTCIIQFLVMRVMEKSVGWLRIMVVYILSGTGGILGGSLFEPYVPHLGPIGSVSGLLGVTMVEILLLWRFINRPFLELGKLLLVMFLFILCGTFRCISVYSVIFGLVIGMCSALVALPYVSFSKISRHTRNILLVVCLLVLFGIYFMLLFIFFKVQVMGDSDSMNCISYTQNMCRKDYDSIS